jgi:hypothetical protein
LKGRGSVNPVNKGKRDREVPVPNYILRKQSTLREIQTLGFLLPYVIYNHCWEKNIRELTTLESSGVETPDPDPEQ